MTKTDAHGRRLTLCWATLALFACTDNPAPADAGTTDSTETSAGDGDGDGDPETGDGDGDGDPGDGDGDPSTGDGDGDPSTGDGDGDPATGEDEWIVHAELPAQLHPHVNPNPGITRFLFAVLPDPAPEIADEVAWTVAIGEDLELFTEDFDNLWRSGPIEDGDLGPFYGQGTDETWAAITEMLLDDVDDVVIYGQTIVQGEGEYLIGYQAKRESWLYEPLPSLDEIRWVLEPLPEVPDSDLVVVELLGAP